MAHEREPIDIRTENRRADPLLANIAAIGVVVGLVGLVGACAYSAMIQKDGMRHLAHTYLVSFWYVLTLSLGALYFVVMHHLTRAGWSVVVRRISEAVAWVLPLMAALAIPVLAWHGLLYEWPSGSAAAHAEEVMPLKAWYLQTPFFIGRCVAYFAIWGFLARYYHRRSVAQDATGDPRETLRRERLSPTAMILFAFTITFAAIDMLMALTPAWYSTMFAVCIFAGSAVAFLALLAVACVGLQTRGYLRNVITAEHYHDIGKLLLSYIIFWAYVGYSQYMLIWYANIPEETFWFKMRLTGGWGWVALVLVLGHFAIPFVGLLSRRVKRTPAALAFWGLWMLAMHYIDLYWVVMPRLDSTRVPASPVDLLCLLGVGGLFVAAVALAARGRSLVPERDPRLAESLLFENA